MVISLQIMTMKSGNLTVMSMGRSKVLKTGTTYGKRNGIVPLQTTESN